MHSPNRLNELSQMLTLPKWFMKSFLGPAQCKNFRRAGVPALWHWYEKPHVADKWPVLVWTGEMGHSGQHVLWVMTYCNAKSCRLSPALGKNAMLYKYLADNIFASCPWRPTTAHGVGILTELYIHVIFNLVFSVWPKIIRKKIQEEDRN